MKKKCINVKKWIRHSNRAKKIRKEQKQANQGVLIKKFSDYSL